MQRVLAVVSAIVMTIYLGAPSFAADPPGAGNTLVAAHTAAPTAAKGKRKYRARRVAKPGLEETVRRIVEEAMAKRSMEWSYMAKRMQPPKSKKWQGRWNNLGAQGWEVVDHNENVYIFKRPGAVASVEVAPKAKAKSQSNYKESKPKKVRSEENVAPATGTKGNNRWR